MSGLFGLSLLVMLIAKVWLGVESRAYFVIWCISFAGLAVSIFGMSWEVTHP